MKSTAINLCILDQMLKAERGAEYSRYRSEIDAPLSRICDSADALGPLVVKAKVGSTAYLLTGDVFYSRFRPGDGVEIRIQKPNSDSSLSLSYGWKVVEVRYPSLGKIEVLISGGKLLDDENLKEVFLFKSCTTQFTKILMRRLGETSNAEKVLGTSYYKMKMHDRNFREIYESLNPAQRGAVDYLVGNNLNGAIQGPPGTGKTQLLRAVITLALNSNMKVYLTSFTNAAVDNLLSRVVSDDFPHSWARVGGSDKIRTDLYDQNLQQDIARAGSFHEAQDVQLIGATLHKIAYSSSLPGIDLLVIDEAGQVPIYFWPFIERLARRVVLVGDQFQLPPVLGAVHENLPATNIFSHVIHKDTPMLEMQYRMRREIQAWSSEKFYKGKLTPHSSVAEQDYFAYSPAFVTDGFVVPKKFNSSYLGKSSQDEANFIAHKVEQLVRSRTSLDRIGVICPYRVQAGVVNAALQSRVGAEKASQVLVDTVERFQGQEKDAIFLSLGTSGETLEELRFLADPKRLNVSVTRAKSRFYCLFNQTLMERSIAPQASDLNEFLRWVTHGKTSIRRAA